jgi:S1-C subfamily serine protease
MMMTASGVSAQDDRDCRCVDADGDAIANCSCFRIPEMPEIMAFGPGDFTWNMSAVRPRLGVTVSADQDDALDARGALVSDVMDDGPADDAGIRDGDIITHVDGRSLLQPVDRDVEEDFDLDESIPVQRLLAIARELEPGESVEVGFLRDGQAQTATVEVEDLAAAWRAWGRGMQADVRTRIQPQMEALRQQLQEQSVNVERARERVRVLNDREPFVVTRTTARYGLSLTELTPGLGDYFGTEQGVLVTDVDADSQLGLRPGDVILRIGDREASSPDRVRRVLGSYTADESVTFRVRRQGSEIDVLGRLGG